MLLDLEVASGNESSSVNMFLELKGCFLGKFLLKAESASKFGSNSRA